MRYRLKTTGVYYYKAYPLQVAHRFRLLLTPDLVHVLVCAHISSLKWYTWLDPFLFCVYLQNNLFAREDDTVVLGLEPFHRVSLGEFVLETDLGGASSALGDGGTWALHDNVEVHTVDTLN